MSITETKRIAIERAIRAKKCSYSCIASKFHVDIEDVRRIARPLQQKRHAEQKAKQSLSKLTSEAKYDRRPYQKPAKKDYATFAIQAVAAFILLCILAAIFSATIGLIRWAFKV